MIIGISGKKQSGKDTIGKIWQILSLNSDYSTQYIVNLINTSNVYNLDLCNNNVEIKKFADKVKEITAKIINCTVEDLEDEKFKNKILDSQWWYYYRKKKWYHFFKKNFTEKIPYQPGMKCNLPLIKPTPRCFLEQIGTECGRNIIHKNIWIYTTLNNYNPNKDNWIITDVRFKNEAQELQTYNQSILIRVNRPQLTNKKQKEHSSETALDNYKNFDYIINNNKDLYNLVEQVKTIYDKTNQNNG